MSRAAPPSGLPSGPGVGRMPSDHRLAQRATEGDRRAFAAIYSRYHQSLYRFCLALLGNPHDAQDALQNTMVKVLRALPGEKRRIQLRPWLYRIAHNESVELLRRRHGTDQIPGGLADLGPGPAQEAALRERLRELVSDLAELPERQRAALVMRELGGLEFAEIGAALDTSPAVARQTVYEARLSLRQMGAGREMSCARVTRALSDADGRVLRRRDVRSHLRACPGCRRFREELEDRRRDLPGLAPLPATTAAGLLHGILGSNGGSAGTGLTGALGGGTGKALATSAVVKSAATVAVVAAVGLAVANRGGLVHLGAGGDHGSPAARGRPSRGSARSGLRSEPTSGARHPRAVGRSAGAPVGGRAGLGASHPAIAVAVAGGAAAPDRANAQVASPPNPSSAAHRHGRGHEKEPSAAAHGRQTAASHKSGGRSGGRVLSHPGHPSKPPHPSHPGTATAQAPPSDVHGHETPPRAASAPRSPNPQETPPSGETVAQP
jgi:RNA polymerase sigma factor (sigma-70 family)